MNSWLATPKVSKLLDTLYADAAKNHPPVRRGARRETGTSEADHYKVAHKAYMAVNRDFGNLLYSLAPSAKAETIVEFGTSFGISTIFLASAVRDNGSSKVITTEFEPTKSERARKNLSAAGLEGYLEFRVGDALQTLSNSPRKIDMLFLDGAKGLYLDVLKLVAQVRSGRNIASDDTDHDGLEDLLEYIRNCNNGYTSSAILSGGNRSRGHEITLRH